MPTLAGNPIWLIVGYRSALSRVSRRAVRSYLNPTHDRKRRTGVKVETPQVKAPILADPVLPDFKWLT
jgi:hypothetical protein